MSVIGLRFTIRRGLLRLGPAWALLAGAALGWVGAGGGMGGMGEGTLPLRAAALAVLALALVEPIWGGVWVQMSALARSFTTMRPGAAMTGEGMGEGTSPLRLPYAKGGAPLTRVWLWLADEEATAAPGLGLAATLLALAGAAAMMLLVHPAGGRAALATSVVVIVLAVMGAALLPAFPATTRLLGAAVGVALPWLLGLGLWGWQTPPPYLWLLIGGICLLAFAEEEVGEEEGAKEGEGTSPLRVAPGYVGVVGALMWVQQPLAAGLAALVFMAAGWRWQQGRPGDSARWHLLALFVALLGLLPVFGSGRR
jgi:hypothetical protein